MSLSSASSHSFRAIFLALIIPLLRLLFSIVSFFLKRFFALAALLGTTSPVLSHQTHHRGNPTGRALELNVLRAQ